MGCVIWESHLISEGFRFLIWIMGLVIVLSSHFLGCHENEVISHLPIVSAQWILTRNQTKPNPTTYTHYHNPSTLPLYLEIATIFAKIQCLELNGIWGLFHAFWRYYYQSLGSIWILPRCCPLSVLCSQCPHVNYAQSIKTKRYLKHNV